LVHPAPAEQFGVVFERELDLEVPSDVHAARRVRAVLEAQCAVLGDALFAAQVIASEFVTNAILHGAPPVRLEVLPTSSGLRLVVHDGRPDVGTATPASRGLRIVDVLAADWGMTPKPGGKCFWADIAAPA
jgi:anti-sigma regulatory factor (Ser/Thr protein kinase)